jgi:hypothetical protein
VDEPTLCSRKLTPWSVDSTRFEVTIACVSCAVKHSATLHRVALATSILIIGGGCSGYRTQRAVADPTSPFAVPSAGRAAICVFRPHGLGASVVSPVSDNGSIVGATSDSSFFCYDAEPGPHRIRTADAPGLAIDVMEGRSYFLAHDLNVGPDTLIRVKRESAEALRAWCGEVEVNAAPRGVAVLKRGEIARADIPRPLRAEAAAPTKPSKAVAHVSTGGE